MALDVYLSPLASKNPADGELIFQFHADGYYWYLQNYWPSSSSTGKAIDLYDDAAFRGKNLEQLGGALGRVSNALKKQPKEWQQVVGRDLQGTIRYSLVKKYILVSLIEKLQQAIKRAESQNMEIHFIGD